MFGVTCEAGLTDFPSGAGVFSTIFSSPSQRQCELLPSGVRRPLTFHILIITAF
jgi:hypothetical protein